MKPVGEFGNVTYITYVNVTHAVAMLYISTVKPVLRGHLRNLLKCPLM